MSRRTATTFSSATAGLSRANVACWTRSFICGSAIARSRAGGPDACEVVHGDIAERTLLEQSLGYCRTRMVDEHVDILIVGAGLSGVGAACHVRENLPGKSFAILEAREDLGGTWDLFR